MMENTELSELMQRESAGEWKWDLDSGAVEFNEVWMETLGFAQAEIGNEINFWLDLLHPDECVSVKSDLFRCRDKVIPAFRTTHRLKKNDGSWITVLSIGAAVRNSNGIYHFFCTQFIVDAAVITHDYLHFHRNLGIALSSTTDLNSAAQISLEAVLRFNHIDAGGVYLFDHDREIFELVGHMGLPDWFLNQNRYHESDSSMSMLLKNEETVSFQCDEHSPNPHEQDKKKQISINALFPIKHLGKLEAVLFLASMSKKDLPASVFDEIEGTVQKIGGTIGRIRAENRMRASEEKHRILLERIGSPILAVNKHLRILFSNEALEDIVDRTRLNGEPICDVFSEELSDVLTSEFSYVLETGNVRQTVLEYRDYIWNVVFSSVPGGVLAVMQDITATEKANIRLDNKSRFENLLINISTGFIEMQGNALNLGINDALMEIGLSIKADRSRLFQIDHPARTVSNTHEWCAVNIEPQAHKLQDIPFNLIPWWMSKLRRQETITIPVVADLPEEASAEREFLEEQQILSHVVIPIVHGDDLVGFLCFDSVHSQRTWSEDIIHLLRVVGDAMGNALLRNLMEAELRMMYHKADEEARMNSVLLREVNHRVKNNLSEIIGLLYAQLRYTEKSKSIGDFVPSLIGRVQGLATVHSMLSDSGWKPIKICDLARQIISNTISVKPGGQRIFSTVPDSDVKANSYQAHSLALILNELVRNSTKYASIDNDQLRIVVIIHQDDSGMISIKYSDNGPGFPEEVIRMERSGLGIDIIGNMVSKNLQGDLSMRNDTGAITEISFTENERI